MDIFSEIRMQINNLRVLVKDAQDEAYPLTHVTQLLKKEFPYEHLLPSKLSYLLGVWLYWNSLEGHLITLLCFVFPPSSQEGNYSCRLGFMCRYLPVLVTLQFHPGAGILSNYTNQIKLLWFFLRCKYSITWFTQQTMQVLNHSIFHKQLLILS